ncbi:hypothetical protein ACFC8N_46265 [Streptomyces sp. NPDC055966]|uniref:hypothetical protein n=1 Tax=unclassified Streptomyces TaxID=2593676 RepID=UPI0035DA46F1
MNRITIVLLTAALVVVLALLAAAAAGTLEYSRIQRAYRAYIDHGKDCPVCAVDTSVCTTASDLWTAYREAHEE